MGSTPVLQDELQGSVFVLIQFDVCEEIRLDRLKQIFSAQTVQRPALKHALPSYIRYERPPVVEATGPLVLESGERLHGQIKYYDYGVVSVILELPFAGNWEKLVQLSSRWVWDVDFSGQVLRIVKERLHQAADALAKPYEEWLSEDYFIFHVAELAGPLTAAQVIQLRGKEISQIVRGDATELSDSERQEVLQSGISYGIKDLAVIGWNAAFLYDTQSGADTAIQLLEYANSQLLEFRHYDELLTNELESVYNSLEKGTGFFARWRLARSATKLNTVLLEVTELTEHADNAIKFLSDMFSARLYKVAAAKVGVPDYKNLVTNKVQTARELYHFMVDQFNQGRAFFLELTVVIILIIELLYLFRGHPF
ncbi:MAG TPA: hypothetical protein VFA02_08815 [Pseudacidobacterium sp.]|nr:hypothetical protein [Pseudacidobacterium sp.]